MTATKRCIIFLIDGARPDVLGEEIRLGNCPVLGRYFIEKGSFAPMLTVFPSTTGPAYMPFLTGCFPGTCNVPGIRWFDRAHYAKHGWSLKSFRSYVGLETHLMNHDMKPGIRTPYHLFDKPYSILNMVNGGIKRGFNRTRFSRIWYYYYGHLTDHWGFLDQASGQKALDVVDSGFDFLFMVLPAVDEYSHRSSPFHPSVRQAYRTADTLIGNVIEALKSRGELDETAIFIVSDHGLSETKSHFDIGPFLEKKGLKTLFYTQIFKRNIMAASMISGNGMAHLYFKSKRGWGYPMTLEEWGSESLLLDELRLRPEVDLLSMRSADGSIHVLNDRGEGFFKIGNGQVAYQWKSADPLGIFNGGNSSRLRVMTCDESLRLSQDSHFPDVFVQLEQLYRSRRTGDVLLSAKSGYDLRERYEVPIHKGTHGALCPEHMKIIFLSNMKLPARDIPARSVDVFPTMLKLMGKPIPEGIDGRPLC